MADPPTGEPPPGDEEPAFTPGTGTFIRRRKEKPGKGKKPATGKKARAFVRDTAPAAAPHIEAAQLNREQDGLNASLFSVSQVSPRTGTLENAAGGDTEAFPNFPISHDPAAAPVTRRKGTGERSKQAAITHAHAQDGIGGVSNLVADSSNLLQPQGPRNQGSQEPQGFQGFQGFQGSRDPGMEIPGPNATFPPGCKDPGIQGSQDPGF